MTRSGLPRPSRILLPILVASLALATSPAVHVEAKGPVRVAASELHGSLEGERTFALPIAASHVALHWVGEAAAQVTAAFSLDGQTFGPPILIGRDEVGEGRANGETYSNLLLAGGARFVRVTSDRPLAHLSILDLDTRGSGQSAMALGSVAAAAAAQPAVISRAGWGADESLRFDATGQLLWAPVFQTIQKLIVHHTATQNNDPDPAATVRAIYYYDAVTQGWGDMGYNFLIDETGHIYEGRYTRTYAPGESPTEEDAAGKGVTGAHALGFNSGTVGIALLGTLTNQDATAAARDALTRLLAWIAGGHGIDPHGSALFTNPVSGTQATFANIAGHRDVAATECPGGVFYTRMPALRDAVAALITPAPTPTPTPAPTPTPTPAPTPTPTPAPTPTPTPAPTPTPTPAPTPTFTLTLSPTSQSVRGGGSVGYTVTVKSLNGFGGAVLLSVSGLPSGSSGSFSPTSVTPTATSLLTIKTAPNPRGTFRFTVRGTSGSLSRTTTGTLQVSKR